MIIRKLKRKLSVVSAISFILTVFCNLSSFALVTGYNSATDIGQSGGTFSSTGYITSATQNDWYKFTLTSEQVATPCHIKLESPADCIYTFDLWYNSAEATGRPSIISNELNVKSSGARYLYIVLTDPGTYYIRVYSLNGTVDADNTYEISGNYTRDIFRGLTVNTSQYESSETADWSICAELLGDWAYLRYFSQTNNLRNYKNAYTFINSGYTSDNANDFGNSKKATPEETAIAANYIYSGDLMLKPKFVVESNKIYEIEELMRSILIHDQPLVFYLANPDLPSTLTSYLKYIAVTSVNIGDNTIKYYDPNENEVVTVDYDQFLSSGYYYNGINVLYSGTNIKQDYYDIKHQTAFN